MTGYTAKVKAPLNLCERYLIAYHTELGRQRQVALNQQQLASDLIWMLRESRKGDE